jgi:hypothetical protein
MPQTITCELFLIVDADGNYSVGTSLDAARESHEEHMCELNGVEGFRLVKLAVKVPLPEVVELTGDVPAHGAASLSIA